MREPPGMKMYKTTVRKSNKALLFLKQHGRAPRANDPEEYPLWHALRRRSYVDKAFEARALAAGWVRASERNQHTEDAIISFVALHMRKPKRKAHDVQERKLSDGMTSRVTKSNTLYSLGFVRRLNAALRDVGLLATAA